MPMLTPEATEQQKAEAKAKVEQVEPKSLLQPDITL